MDDFKLGFYKHYKGKKYEVIGVAKHSDTLKDFVVYRALYVHPKFGEHALWVRPLEMFLENVIVNGQSVPRFEFLHQ